MQIGFVADHEDWEYWPQAKIYLEPARKVGGFASVIEPDEILWAVMDGDELLACATAWLGDGFVEIKLVGGKRHRLWIKELDEMIGKAAKDAGAGMLVAFGRHGWTGVLARQGWTIKKMDNGNMAYMRRLEV